MGQPITVVTKPSSRAGVVRYETNRSLTGMGHQRIQPDDERLRDTPADELARRGFANGGIANLHVNGNVITGEFSDTGVDGVEEIISGLYLYWVEGVEVLSDDELTGAVG